MITSLKMKLDSKEIRSVGIFAAILFGVLFLLGESDYGRLLTLKVERPVYFKIRAYFGLEPPVNEKIKIYSIDDKTFSKMGSWVLTSNDWLNVFNKITAKNPKIIYIDAVQSKFIGSSSLNAAHYQSILDSKVPIVAASFFAPKKVPYYNEVNLSSETYSNQTHFPEESSQIEREKFLNQIPDRRGLFFYGPSKDWKQLYSSIGIINSVTDGRIIPAVRATDNHTIPHLFMHGFENWRFGHNHFSIAGKRAYLDRDGLLPLNYVSTSKLYKKNRPIANLLDPKVKESSIVKEGDYVFILPHFYTGNTDFRWSPLGYIPGGFEAIFATNSVLSSGFLLEILTTPWTLLLSLGLAFLSGVYLGTKALVLMNLGFCLLGFGLVALFFSVYGFLIDFGFGAFGFVLLSVFVLYQRQKKSELKSALLRSVLAGSVSKKDIESIVSSDSELNLEPRECEISIVFIDIVGFSVTSAKLPPKQVFKLLKATLQRISTIVHEFDGVVDKSLGDGLLCYFGYRYDKDHRFANHAMTAIKCALEIQKTSIAHQKSIIDSHDFLMPFRIGIHSTKCFLGDLGEDHRIDFTVVGNGVNFAKRLESACGINRVLISKETKEIIPSEELEFLDMSILKIKVKHQDHLTSAYEIVTKEKKVDIDNVETYFKVQMNALRQDLRQKIPPGIGLKFYNKEFEIWIKELSFSGASGITTNTHLELDEIYSTKIAIQLNDKSVLETFISDELSFKIVWKKAIAQGWQVGVRFTSVDSNRELIEKLSSYCMQFEEMSRTENIMEA